MILYRAIYAEYDDYDDHICSSEVEAKKAICDLFFKHEHIDSMIKYDQLLSIDEVKQYEKMNDAIISGDFELAYIIISINSSYRIEKVTIDPKLTIKPLDKNLFQSYYKRQIFK